MAHAYPRIERCPHQTQQLRLQLLLMRSALEHVVLGIVGAHLGEIVALLRGVEESAEHPQDWVGEDLQRWRCRPRNAGAVGPD